MRQNNISLIILIALLVIGTLSSSTAQIRNEPPGTGPEIRFDVTIQSVTINGFRPLQTCDKDLKANFTIVIKNNRNIQSPSLSLQIQNGPYTDVPFVITSVDGITQSEFIISEINKIAPNATKVVMGNIPIGSNPNRTDFNPVFTAKVDLSQNDEVNGDYSELNYSDNEKTFNINLSGQVFPVYKFCECYPINDNFIDTSKTYILKAYVWTEVHFSPGGVRTLWEFPVFQVTGDDNLHIENHYNNVNDAKVKLRIVNIFRRKGEMPKYRIIYPDGRSLRLSAGYINLTNRPNFTSDLSLDKSHDLNHYHIYQRNYCVAMETKSINSNGQLINPYLTSSNNYSNAKSQLFVLQPVN